MQINIKRPSRYNISDKQANFEDVSISHLQINGIKFETMLENILYICDTDDVDAIRDYLEEIGIDI